MTGVAMPDIPRFYTAVAEWVSCLIFIMILKPRLDIRIRRLVSGVFFIGMCAFMEITANVWLWLWIPCMITAFVIMNAYVFLCCDVRVEECLYYTSFAFVIAEALASIAWQVANLIYVRALELPTWLHVIWIAGIYGGCFLFLWKTLSPHVTAIRTIAMTSKEWYMAIIGMIMVFTFSNLRFMSQEVAATGMYSKEIANTRTMIDIAGVAILYAHLVMRADAVVRMELESVQKVLENQYQQYKLSKDSIDLINYKYHDLKHQIAVLRAEQDPERRNDFLNQIEESIKQYEVQNKTGNKVLDTVLTGKSIYCEKHQITLTSVVDGKLLNFMDTMDICSIFGNALENAIESVMKIKEKEKRLIHLSVSKQREFLMISIENYYEEELRYSEGELQSTKPEKSQHGFGIKSIQYIVNKYNGALNINAENNWFSLKILMPL